MKRAMLVILMAAALAGCKSADYVACQENEAWGHHTMNPWTEAVWNDKIQREVQERTCACCNVKEVRTVKTDAS